MDRNSEPGGGFVVSAPILTAGVQRVVDRRSLIVMLGGLSLLGPLSIDAYLPAFADIQREFHASTADLQLTLTGYLLAFACMSLVHGPLSDAFGRRRVILFALLAFALGALGCALSPSVGWLTAFRVVHGMSAGVGTVVGRAIIRDCFEGAAATRLLALVSMIFSLSPALAPVFGGWVVTLFTWRAIFLTLFAYAVAMLILCLRRLPETLPRHARRPTGIGIMARQYVAVFGNRRFRFIALAIALNFAGLFLYVASVPAFIGHELGLPRTEYAVMFVPIVASTVLGSLAAERLAGRVASTRLILAGFCTEVVTGIVNVTFHAAYAAAVPLVGTPAPVLRLWHVARRTGPNTGRAEPVPADAWYGSLLSGLRHGTAGRSGNAPGPSIWWSRARPGDRARRAVHCRFRRMARHDPALRSASPYC
jgi:DHA1 family bicyclomycin/chloramphenicol resistance-like MFS transporter